MTSEFLVNWHHVALAGLFAVSPLLLAGLIILASILQGRCTACAGKLAGRHFPWWLCAACKAGRP